MGRKRTRARKFIYLCITGLISVAFLGFVVPGEVDIEIKDKKRENTK